MSQAGWHWGRGWRPRESNPGASSIWAAQDPQSRTLNLEICAPPEDPAQQLRPLRVGPIRIHPPRFCCAQPTGRFRSTPKRGLAYSTSASVGECPFTVADTHTQVGYTRGSGGKLAASRSEVPQLAIIFRCYRLGEQFIGLEKTSKACTTRLHRSVSCMHQI